MSTKVDLTGAWRTFCGTAFGMGFAFDIASGPRDQKPHFSQKTREMGHPVL
jgi:hypothetical protein